MSDIYKQFDLENAKTFDALRKFYPKHINAMTKENLHGKSDIAWELSYRDNGIKQLEAERDALQAKLDKIAELYATNEVNDVIVCKTEEILGERVYEV